MAKLSGRANRHKRPLLRLSSALLAVAVILIIVAVAIFCGFLYLFGSIDDPYRPRAPSYEYTVSVSGLEGFTTDNATAVIMVPVPALNGTPLITLGWTPGDTAYGLERRHGTEYAEPVVTDRGPMLAIGIGMTDYYLSYDGATPIAISPGVSGPFPTIEPVLVNKSPSFEDVLVTQSLYMIDELDYPTSPAGREAVAGFLREPLLPAGIGMSPARYTSYVYVDPALKPMKSGSTLNFSITMEVTLNHNKVDRSQEGARSFEHHRFVISELIPAGTSGFIPVMVQNPGPSSEPL